MTRVWNSVKKVDDLSENQSKHYKRNVILAVVGIVITMVMGIITDTLTLEGIETFVTDFFGME